MLSTQAHVSRVSVEPFVGETAKSAWTASVPTGLRLRPIHVIMGGMDTSTAPEPKIMLALTLRYAEDNEAAADRYLRGALRFFMFDLYPHEAFELVRTFAIDTTDNIRDLEGREVASRIGAALRRLIDHVEADKAFMAELTELAY